MIPMPATSSSAKAHWVIEEQIYPMKSILDERLDARSYTPIPYQVLCRECGLVWATRFIHPEEGSKNLLPKWSFRYKRCIACGHGSLWEPNDRCFNASLPDEWVKVELFRLATAIENNRVKEYLACTL